MGKIFTVGGQKGGPGKSAIAQSLAVCLHQRNQRVLLVDADTKQKTTYYWAQDREEEQPASEHIECVLAEGDISPTLLAHKEKYDWVIVDVGGADSKAMRSAAVVTDHMLIPLRPKRRDLKTLSHMKSIMMRIHKSCPDLDARMIITQCPTLPSQHSRILEAKDVARDFGFNVMDSITFTRNAWDDAEEFGLSVMEYTDAKAKAEVINICKEFGLWV